MLVGKFCEGLWIHGDVGTLWRPDKAYIHATLNNAQLQAGRLTLGDRSRLMGVLCCATSNGVMMALRGQKDVVAVEPTLSFFKFERRKTVGEPTHSRPEAHEIISVCEKQFYGFVWRGYAWN